MRLPSADFESVSSPRGTLLHCPAYQRINSLYTFTYLRFPRSTNSHNLVPNTGTNRHQNRHQIRFIEELIHQICFDKRRCFDEPIEIETSVLPVIRHECRSHSVANACFVPLAVLQIALSLEARVLAALRNHHNQCQKKDDLYRSSNEDARGWATHDRQTCSCSTDICRKHR